MKVKNVLIMTWGVKSRAGWTFKKQDLIVSLKMPIYIGWDTDKIVGRATNFRGTDEGLWCDCSFKKQITDTIAPRLLTEELNGITSIKKIVSLSFITDHVCKECNGNLNE